MGDCFTDEVQEDNLANFIEKVGILLLHVPVETHTIDVASPSLLQL